MTDDWFKVTYPLCTIATTPRLPEHCIEYVKVIQWDKQNPWGVSIDGDDPAHINWIYERAAERAAKFNIEGVTYRLVQVRKVFNNSYLRSYSCSQRTKWYRQTTGLYDEEKLHRDWFLW